MFLKAIENFFRPTLNSPYTNQKEPLMPKNQVSDPITDQEIAFAHLVLSGTMTDRHAAEATGLNPDTAAYTKAKPRVRAYMLDHRAAVHQQLVQQETEGLRRLNLGRERVLTRLWEVANLSPEMTRGSVNAQVKALTMIVAIEGLIPDRPAVSPAVSLEKKSTPLPTAQIDASAWLREQQGKTALEPRPDLVRGEDGAGVPDPPSGAAPEAPPPPDTDFDPTSPAFVERFTSLATATSAPRVPVFFERDTREPFSIKKNRLARAR
jgi:hypothetical protein